MRPFRFLHASDLHLERPPSGVVEIPEHLRDLLAEAPYRAAARLFEAAERHEVDFVLLVGDVLDAELSGPRGAIFLSDQFARLAQRNIGVYWVGGEAERFGQWPAAMDWPSNVTIFPHDRPLKIDVVNQGRSICSLISQSRPASRAVQLAEFNLLFEEQAERSFVVVAAYGDFDDADLQSQQVDYWAFGGQHELTLPLETKPVAHYPGSPQARNRGELGAHGCTVVQVTDEGNVRTTPVITDVLRYDHIELRAPATQANAPEQLEHDIKAQLQLLADANPDVALIVTIELTQNHATPVPRRFPLPAIIAAVRGQYGFRSPPVWLDRVRTVPILLSDKWLHGENLLADFLRAAQHFEQSPEEIDFARFLPDGLWRDPLAEVVSLSSTQQARRAVLEAASLGAGLLQIEEARP